MRVGGYRREEGKGEMHYGIAHTIAMQGITPFTLTMHTLSSFHLFLPPQFSSFLLLS